MLTEQQKMERRKGIGGSDAQAFTRSPFKTLLQVYLSKVDDNYENEKTEAQYWGSALETLIAKRFEEKTVKQCVKSKKTFVHAKHQFMRANIDRLIKDENAILECKTVRYPKKEDWGKPGTDEMPKYYMLQCAHYAAVLNVEKVYLAALMGGNEFHIYFYDRNKKLEKRLIEREEEFWHNNVLKRIPPEPANDEDIKYLFGEAEENIVIADSKVESLYFEYLSAKKKLNEIEAIKKEKELIIKKHIGKANKLVDGFGRILATWDNQRRKSFDSSKLRNENEELYKQYIVEKQFRVFRTKEQNHE